MEHDGTTASIATPVFGWRRRFPLGRYRVESEVYALGVVLYELLRGRQLGVDFSQEQIEMRRPRGLRAYPDSHTRGGLYMFLARSDGSQVARWPRDPRIAGERQVRCDERSPSSYTWTGRRSRSPIGPVLALRAFLRISASTCASRRCTRSRSKSWSSDRDGALMRTRLAEECPDCRIGLFRQSGAFAQFFNDVSSRVARLRPTR